MPILSLCLQNRGRSPAGSGNPKNEPACGHSKNGEKIGKPPIMANKRILAPVSANFFRFFDVARRKTNALHSLRNVTRLTAECQGKVVNQDVNKLDGRDSCAPVGRCSWLRVASRFGYVIGALSVGTGVRRPGIGLRGDLQIGRICALAGRVAPGVIRDPIIEIRGCAPGAHPGLGTAGKGKNGIQAGSSLSRQPDLHRSSQKRRLNH